MPLIFMGLGGLGLGSALGFGVSQGINKALTATAVVALLYLAYKSGVFR
ncbi:hypothetical protein JC606_16635 [Vibrio sp. IB15]|nr:MULTISPECIES: hypothetical protein [Vibrio]MBJ2147989.1 hypothetical protein [Vibrio sp. IB15]MCG9565931.1 hypothetical protein [Vibrio chagasii]MCG9674424.1 hypothetical protein [Vibrio chagasii]MCG9692420.1 hypothetical protein [Vibrio sp. Isolate22]MDA0155506.1 hypothetical protein [Vibrio sp. Makdt]